ncbi:MAG: BtrH N-terminal domain-containing protein [Gammaproteobacteria bacterium]|nr:MAG: BtrH N-terminal domain-containing protein [Gammaproteobacteria bacterium]
MSTDSSQLITDLNNFNHRHAAHCESGTVTTLLRSQGLDLTEAMVFGLGGGIFFIYMPLFKMAGMPLTAYRDAPRIIIKNICKRLGVRMRSHRYRTPEEGMAALDDFLMQGIPVGIQGNVFWLPYFPEEMRFQYNGHNMVVFGKKDNEYLVSDPVVEQATTCPAADLQRARFAKGAFAPKGLLYYPDYVPTDPDIAGAIPVAIKTTAKRMTEIPIPFFGVRGMRFMANRLIKWPEKFGIKRASALIGNVVRMQEEIGTGGAGFRFIYAAFLQEAGDLLDNEALREASKRLSRTGDRWREFALLGAQLCKGRKQDPAAYKDLANVVRDCADREEAIFNDLKKVF